jgi:hypothetical protein
MFDGGGSGLDGEAMMKRAAVLAFALFAGAGFAVIAHAEELTDLAKQAEGELKNGKNVEAYDTARKAALQVWNAGPLVFRKAIFVSSKPGGFGVYDPRPDNMFKPGEKLIIYVEPVGFTWKPKDSLNHAQLIVDLELKDGDGNVVAQQQGFGNFTFDSREQNMETMTVVTIDFADAPAGKYAAELTFHDTVGDKSASLELPFEIKEKAQ